MQGPPPPPTASIFKPIINKINNNANGRDHADADEEPHHNSAKPGQPNARLGEYFLPDHRMSTARRPTQPPDTERHFLRFAVGLMQSHGSQLPDSQGRAPQGHD